MAKPDYFLLDAGSAAQIERYLRDRDWLEGRETLRAVSIAGEGNMNCTLRIDTGERTFILKQSRPWVEKYPHIAAPEERILIEGLFYRSISGLPAVADKMPHLMAIDEQNRIIQLQDVGSAGDLTSLYQHPDDWETVLADLCRWLSALHAARFAEDIRKRMVNREMRALNHEHLFRFPLLPDNGLVLDSITPGLQAAADHLKSDRPYVQAITELGKQYLADGKVLLHGDYFPGSWLKTDDHLWVIDPEFAFFGPAEYDAGVMMAHYLISGQPLQTLKRIYESYQPPAPFEAQLAVQFCGMEIMRRLIGVAQLPVTTDLEQKRFLLSLSRDMVLNPGKVIAGFGVR